MYKHEWQVGSSNVANGSATRVLTDRAVADVGDGYVYSLGYMTVSGTLHAFVQKQSTNLAGAFAGSDHSTDFKYDVLTSDVPTNGQWILKAIGTTIYFIWYSSSGSTWKYNSKAYGASWSATATIGNQSGTPVDIVSAGGNIWLMLVATTTTVKFVKITDGTLVSATDTEYGASCLGIGNTDGTTYYFGCSVNNNFIGRYFYWASFNGTSVSFRFNPVPLYSLAYTYSPVMFIVYYTTPLKFMVITDNFWASGYGNIADQESTGVSGRCVDYGTDGIPKYIMSYGSLYKVFQNGAIALMPKNSAGSGVVFQSGYMIGSTNTYSVALKEIIVTGESKCRMGRNIEDRCQFENTSESWNLNSFQVLCDDSGNVKFQGFVDSVEDNSRIIIRSPIEEALKINIPAATGVVSTLVSNAIVTSKWLTAGTITTTTTSRTWNGGSMDEFFKWAEEVEAFVWNYTALFVSNFAADGASSGYSYTFGDGKIIYLEPSTKNYKIQSVTLYGAGISSSVISSSNIINGQKMTDWYPRVTLQAELDSIAANLMAKNSQTIVSIEADILVDNISFGTWITLDYSPESLSSDTYFVVNVGYDFVQKSTHIFAVSAIMYQLTSPTAPFLVDPIDQKVANTAIISKGTSFPASPNEGDLYWHTTDEALYRYSMDAAAWIAVGNGCGFPMEDAVTDGVTDKCPTENAVYDALALKPNLIDSQGLFPCFPYTTGFTFPSGYYGYCCSAARNAISGKQLSSPLIIVPSTGTYKFRLWYKIHNTTLGAAINGKWLGCHFAANDGGSWNLFAGSTFDTTGSSIANGTTGNKFRYLERTGLSLTKDYVLTLYWEATSNDATNAEIIAFYGWELIRTA